MTKLLLDISPIFGNTPKFRREDMTSINPFVINELSRSHVLIYRFKKTKKSPFSPEFAEKVYRSTLITGAFLNYRSFIGRRGL
jgi:hypothetical protein